MSEELFQVAESLSPYQAFIQRHAVMTMKSAHLRSAEQPWTAYIKNQFAAVIGGWLDPELLGYGVTEREAVLDLGIKQSLDGYNNFDWGV